MIYDNINGKPVTAGYKGNKIIVGVYKCIKLIWEFIRSCFGKGYWRNDFPFVNDDSWKNNDRV